MYFKNADGGSKKTTQAETIEEGMNKGFVNGV